MVAVSATSWLSAAVMVPVWRLVVDDCGCGCGLATSAFAAAVSGLRLAGDAGDDEARLVGEYDELRAVADGELGHDAADVGLRGQRAQEELARDLVVGQAPGDQAEHLALTLGQPGEIVGRLACRRPGRAAATRAG